MGPGRHHRFWPSRVGGGALQGAALLVSLLLACPRLAEAGPDENPVALARAEGPAVQGAPGPGTPAVAPVDSPPAVPAPVPPLLLIAGMDLSMYLWPRVPEIPAPREVDLPRESLAPVIVPALLAEWERLAAPDPVADVGDAILKGPEVLFDEVVFLVSRIFPRQSAHAWTPHERRSLTLRLTEMEVVPRQGRIFSDFLAIWTKREIDFFADFGGSYLSTPGFEDGVEDMDTGELAFEQGKLLWDALRKTYFSKYKFKAEERIRDEAFYFRQWQGVDYLALPPLMAGYLYYRGLEKRFSVAGTWLGVSLEPGSRWADRDRDLVAGAGVEWRPKGFPIALLVSVGMYDGDAELDFVGIGTSLGMARKALRLRHGE